MNRSTRGRKLKKQSLSISVHVQDLEVRVSKVVGVDWVDGPGTVAALNV
jgi:hypothetical protein